MIRFLTSDPIGTYRSEKPPVHKGLNPANGLVRELKKHWKEETRCLLVSAFPEEHERNDRMRKDFETILRDTGLPFSCMDLCDALNGEEKAAALPGYDFVILGGGHVPTQNAFFHRIGLAERFRGFSGIAMGISAGTMNCAREVYAQPEMPGEASDPAYRRFLPGLGLTEYRILPHYNAVKDDLVDGLRLMEDITYPDSAGRTFYALTDGSYLFETEEEAQIRGLAYRIRDGVFAQVCEDGGVYPLRRKGRT